MQGKMEQHWIELATLRREGCNSGRKKIGLWEQVVGATEREEVLGGEKGKGCHPRVQGQSREEAADMGCQSQEAHHWPNRPSRQEHLHQKGHPQPRRQEPHHPQGLSGEPVQQHPGEQTEGKASRDFPHTLICQGCSATSIAHTKDFQ